MKKLLLVALVLGLILARRVTAREYPPLPPMRDRQPVDAPGITARPTFAAWNFESPYLDVLEMSADAVTWIDVVGPYPVVELDGRSNYYVRIPIGYAKAFFRVRRVWGNPWVN